MYLSIALGFFLAFAAFGLAAYVADRRYGRTLLPPQRRQAPAAAPPQAGP